MYQSIFFFDPLWPKPSYAIMLHCCQLAERICALLLFSFPFSGEQRAKRHLIVMGGEEVLSHVHPWSEVSKEADKIGGGMIDASRLYDYLVG